MLLSLNWNVSPTFPNPPVLAYDLVQSRQETHRRRLAFLYRAAAGFVKFCKPRGKGYPGNVAMGRGQTILAELVFLAGYGHLPYLKKMLNLLRDIMAQVGNAVLSVDWLMNNDDFYFNKMAIAGIGMTKPPEELRAFVSDQLARRIHDNHACK